MGEVLKKFGRYFLLDHIAQGGMAEIYRARLAAADGAGRLIVIKRIQAGYGANTEFLQMFKSEIKVTMGFNHPNIVQLYDFGEEQQQPYIAMELVDGKNLRQLMSRFAELKQTFPVDLAALIIEQAAGGLHYAHSFKDKITGAPLNIVHRDISPQNILVSYDGNVKVIDFGIAKASSNSESTRAGVIKGKPSYLSPEQISGETLDGRCDLFALGIVLWELLCGKKLFAGENDLAVLKLIESCTTHVKPPSSINPAVPKELDYIVLRALAKQREKRYQSGEEMQRALHKFIYQHNGDFEPGVLSSTCKDLFKNEIVEDRKRIQKLNDKVEQLMATDIPEAPPVPELGRGKDDTGTLVDPKERPTGGTREIFNPATVKDAKIEMEAPTAARLRSPRARPGASGAPGSAPLTMARNTPNSARPAAPQQRLSNQKASSSGGMGKPIAIGAVALLLASIFGPEMGFSVPVLSDLVNEYAGGGKARPDQQGKKKVEQKPASVAVNNTPNAPVDLNKVDPGKNILLRLNVTPGGGTPAVAINGRPLDLNNPALLVPLDAPLELSAERQGFKPFRREFVLEARQMNGLKEWLMDVQMEPVKFGFLTVHTTPSADATIMLDGRPWVKKTPIENEKLPVGTYNIRLSNEVLGMEKTITVSVQEGKAVTKDERLEIMRDPASH